MSQQKFHVVVARPVVMATVVEVEASSEEEALSVGASTASLVSPERWSVVSNEWDYAADVVAVVPDDEIDEHHDVVRMSMENERYLLLRGNVGVGEGSVVQQPWFESRSDLMQSDLLADWIEDLQGAASSRVVVDDIRERAAHKLRGGADH
jgi:hypothetical protein